MERAMASMEFGLANGGYHLRNTFKRYLPQGTFGLLIADEAHEIKNAGRPGAGDGVLASKARRRCCCPSTFDGRLRRRLVLPAVRALPGRNIEDGYRPSKQGSMTSGRDGVHAAITACSKDIYSESNGSAHQTAKGSKDHACASEGPGFGFPRGVLALRIAVHHLPQAQESRQRAAALRRGVPRSGDGRGAGAGLMDACGATDRRAEAGAEARPRHDAAGWVLNVLLGLAGTCFRSETVKHSAHPQSLASRRRCSPDLEVIRKERGSLIDICREEKAAGSASVLVYSVYTGTRDTTSRLRVAYRSSRRLLRLRAWMPPAGKTGSPEQLDRGSSCVRV